MSFGEKIEKKEPIRGLYLLLLALFVLPIATAHAIESAPSTPTPLEVNTDGKLIHPWILAPSFGGWLMTSGLDMAVGGSVSVGISKRTLAFSWLSYGADLGMYTGVSGLFNLASVFPLFLGGTIGGVVMVPLYATLTAHPDSGTVRPTASLSLGLASVSVSGTRLDGTKRSINTLYVTGMGRVGLEFWFWDNFSITWDLARVGWIANQVISEMALGVAFPL